MEKAGSSAWNSPVRRQYSGLQSDWGVSEASRMPADMISFGPVPSRRLGRSLGINNIPPKACSYSCVYCQVGPTARREIEPRPFYPPEVIGQAVAWRVREACRAGEQIDFLTFVPDGEPTLDSGLSETIDLLRPLGIPIAVISNGSLLWRREIREVLKRVDWVSVKVDSVEQEDWRRVNRPHPDLRLDAVLSGMLAFAAEYEGVLNSETLLVDGVNADDASVAGVAEFLHALMPRTAYLSIPTRPPAVAGIQAPDEERMNRVYQIVRPWVAAVELLTGYEGNAFAVTGDPMEDLLSITAVHPMREGAVRQLLARTGGSWRAVQALLDAGELREAEFAGRKFYIRCFPGGRSAPG
jgi:wyosine [tRNA(Phe)-imidazoG37] synthetase (radical SAM superfamily)